MAWTPIKPPFREFKKDVYKKAGLVSDFIFQIGEYEHLRKPSREIPKEEILSEEMQQKFAYIKKCITDYRSLTGYGRGITGVQIGIPERFSVVYTPEKLIVIINPSITKKSEKKYIYPEMCMSASPIIAPTIRPAWIEFTYYDEKGEKRFWNTKDDSDLGKILNRVFQHEIDHMDGVINIDIVQSPKDLILESDPTFYATAAFVEVK